MPLFTCPECLAPWDVPAHRLETYGACPNCGDRVLITPQVAEQSSQPSETRSASDADSPTLDEAAIASAAQGATSTSRYFAYVVAGMVELACVVGVMMLVGNIQVNPLLISGYLLSILVGLALFANYWFTRYQAYDIALASERARAIERLQASESVEEKTSGSWASILVTLVSVIGLFNAFVKGAGLGTRLRGGRVDDGGVILVGMGVAALGAWVCWRAARSSGFVRALSIAHILFTFALIAYGCSLLRA